MRLACVSALVVVLVLPAYVAGQAADGMSAMAHAQSALERAVLLGSDDLVPKGILRDASVENVVFVHHPETLEPVYGLAMIRSTEGKVVGLIGIDPDRGKAIWYRFDLDEERFLPNSLDEAQVLVREHARAHALSEDVGTGILVSAPDKHLYWRFETSGGRVWLIDGQQSYPLVLSAEEVRARETGCCPSPQLDSRREQPRSRILESDGVPIQQILGARTAACNISGIPYHFQITDWYCCLASMQMIFDYYGTEIGQHNQADVAPDYPPSGVYHEGIVRCVLFSGMSTAIDNPSLQGYPERQLGYACGDYWWGNLPAGDRPEVLKSLVYAHYPILVATWYDEGHTAGHCRIVKGYDDNLNVFIIHDPWYYGVMSGPNLMIDQVLFVNLWIDYSYGESVLIKPWILRPSFPSTVSQGDTFAIDLKVIYPGPYPFNGLRGTHDQFAQISLAAGLTLESPGATISLPTLYTGDSTTVTWNIIASGSPGEYGMAFHAQGTVDQWHSEYGSYSDSIGGHAYETVEVTSGLLADWDSEERLTNDDAASHTCFPGGRAMVVEDNGTVHIVWEEIRDGDSEIYYRRRSGGSWGSETRLTTSSGLSWSPCIARGPDGSLHVAWVDSRDGNHEIYYKTWDPLGGWSSDERVTNRAEVDFNPSIAVGDTAVYVAWELRAPSGSLRKHAVYFRQRTALAWSPYINVDFGSAEKDSYRPSLMYGPDGLLHVVYERSTTNDTNEKEKIIHKSWDGVSWSGRTGLSSDLSYSRNPVIATGPDSSRHVVWQDGENTGGDIFYVMYDGTAWQPVEQIVTGGTEAGTPSVSVGKEGEVHVVWVDNRHGEAEIYYKSKDDVGWSEDARLTKASEISILPTVAANQTGEVCVVWTDFRHGDAEIYFRSAGSLAGMPAVPGVTTSDDLVFLSQPYPVPFASEVHFSVNLREASQVSLEVFDVMGRCVRILADRTYDAGSHHAVWDGRDNLGQEASPGIYFVCCGTPQGNSVRRVVLVR